ncbi:hypothetical protein C1637_09670 [Chryseobacterium lactis]|uniref:Uncharacterized protein n=1 Tax=Chryseobacterium lactis TaxID=1241981 RepID=A0A3G6RKM6_CHRLC|nr:hypothetical protein [Chryseobacterium lactis]AZA82223.1 hypothetical protein EG342_10035 [Chryseobacterium lactis]AZB02604.1 hypothetical protein EG341_00890 [Chryseobacterium lactis]PNW14102.1 hypothetical protein C1637_09670 [Chryseobacterium lactis]
MSRLEFKDGIYRITKKIPFTENMVKEEFISIAFKFAYEMAYGEGFHRDHRSGGSLIRTPDEVFANTFQGKLAELILDDELKKNDITTSGVDLGIFEKGIWDHGDIVANGKNINVKSMAFFANLFLLECKDWDENGTYTPDGGAFIYDYFVCVRIKPNLKDLFKNGDSDIEKMSKILNMQDLYFDIPGVLSHETLKEIIKREYILKKGDKLNQTTMDADNYYIQSGDLKDINLMYNKLKDL